jgi:putative hydrolase of the HAD superfamily
LNFYKHIFFDLDRTLWDFDKNSTAMLKYLYENYLKDSTYSHFLQFKNNYESINAKLWKLYGSNKISKEELRSERFKQTLALQGIYDVNLANQLSDEYVEKSPRQTQLFPNTKDCLNTLKREGYQLHIITNGFKEVQFIKLECAEIRSFFDVIVCSEMVGYNKPDKRIFEYALELTNAKPHESVMIGDDLEVDILGANRVGMQSVLFDPAKKHKFTSGFQVIHDLVDFPLKIKMI